ncbi:MAG: electron transfer flavoprotein subunit alpha/FixB family protein [Proteobacteria bacterium]|nr:electron transfer flavoprotein subunit alpha/FixB family protein [Pseudomonadota bacterium]
MIRRDPRAERDAMVVSRTPRLRLDRTHRGGTLLTGADAPVAAPTIIHIAEPAFLVFAVIEAAGGALNRHDRQVIGAARTLAGRDAAVVVLTPHLPSQAPDAIGTAGGDRTITLPTPTYDPERSAALIAQAITDHAPRHVVFPESADGGDLARRVAALTDADLFAGAESLTPTQAIRPAQAGRVELRATPPRLISIAPDRIAPHHGAPHAADPLPTPDAAATPGGIRAATTLAVDAATIPLDQAPLVIAAGNGVTDFAGFLDLARALGATPGASRVVCDAGALPRALQVGASGTVLNAECYIALGISGAPQHLQGIGTVEHIVAINTDLHAAIIARAGLAIIADAQDVMQALRAML